MALSERWWYFAPVPDRVPTPAAAGVAQTSGKTPSYAQIVPRPWSFRGVGGKPAAGGPVPDRNQGVVRVIVYHSLLCDRPHGGYYP
ncbi:hypothetical protein A33M_2822 [Rhodovulum sp. PH10]|nr:hypothetical protein A33M_2822 [Rhodovulum sp. PH10]